VKKLQINNTIGRISDYRNSGGSGLAMLQDEESPVIMVHIKIDCRKVYKRV
jgi:hypothetical protein